MANNLNYISVYRSNLVKFVVPKLVVKPVRLVPIKGPFALSVPGQQKLVVAAGEPMEEVALKTIEFPEGDYFAFYTRIHSDDERDAARACEGWIDQAIANLSISTVPSIFAFRLYQGWVKLEGDDMFAKLNLKWGPPFEFDDGLRDQWQAITDLQSTNPGVVNRIKLMGRYLAKAMNQLPDEDCFISLWTMLEIWPMAGGSDIRPITDVLGLHVGMNSRTLKEKLGIGRLYGLRSALLHDGAIEISDDEMTKTIAKLQDICVESMRQLSGLPYAGILDRYLE